MRVTPCAFLERSIGHIARVTTKRLNEQVRRYHAATILNGSRAVEINVAATVMW